MRGYLASLIWLLLLLTPGSSAAADAAPVTPSVSVQSPQNGLFIKPGSAFRDCADCPEMMVIPAGKFLMGSPEDEQGRGADEGPVHEVTIERPFAIGRFEITFTEWQACVTAGGCREALDDRRWEGGARPVNDISWHDAKAYTQWLSGVTGFAYRLPSEAEWEYAARAGATTPRYWRAREIACAYANVYDMSGSRLGLFDWPSFDCIDASAKTAPVGKYLPNKFGLHDTLGNVWEWVEDCWVENYLDAPTDGSARLTGDCTRRIQRGGSWKNVNWATRLAFRSWKNENDRDDAAGFRVMRESD